MTLRSPFSELAQALHMTSSVQLVLIVAAIAVFTIGGNFVFIHNRRRLKRPLIQVFNTFSTLSSFNSAEWAFLLVIFLLTMSLGVAAGYC